jgi:hypothetical protein
MKSTNLIYAIIVIFLLVLVVLSHYSKDENDRLRSLEKQLNTIEESREREREEVYQRLNSLEKDRNEFRSRLENVESEQHPVFNHEILRVGMTKEGVENICGVATSFLSYKEFQKTFRMKKLDVTEDGHDYRVLIYSPVSVPSGDPLNPYFWPRLTVVLKDAKVVWWERYQGPVVDNRHRMRFWSNPIDTE